MKKQHIYNRVNAKTTKQLCDIVNFLLTKDNKTFLLSFDIQYVFNECYYLIEERNGLNFINK
jgi:hypothetical protein